MVEMLRRLYPIYLSDSIPPSSVSASLSLWLYGKLGLIRMIRLLRLTESNNALI